MEKCQTTPRQWESTLNTYASPVFGKLPVDAIDENHVMRYCSRSGRRRLRPRAECGANRICPRLGDRAEISPGGKPGPDGGGHLDVLLPKPSKVAKVRHHPALRYAEIGDFMNALRKAGGYCAACVENLLLTGARISEVVNGRWDEIDLANKTWTIPKRAHEVQQRASRAVSDAAIRIIKAMQPKRNNAYHLPRLAVRTPPDDCGLPETASRHGLHGHHGSRI